MSTQISLRLPDTLLAELDRRARGTRARRSDLIRDILQVHLLGSASTARDHPYARVRDLIGSVSGGPPDMGARHRERLLEVVRDRRR